MSVIPGQNLLAMALTLIAHQNLIYYRAIGRELNDLGQYVTIFDTGIELYGSWQPVPRQLYMQYGLDLQKDYFTFYTSNDILDLARDITADQVAFNSELFQVESNNDWYALDGWKGILCIRIGPDTQRADVFGFNTTLLTNSYLNFENSNFFEG